MAKLEYVQDAPNLKGKISGLKTYHTDAYMIAVRNGFKGTEKEWLATIENNYVTPQMYGAKGDGVTDDTEAIRRAIESHACVQFPEGTYLVSETLSLSKAVQISGCGMGETKILHKGSGHLFDTTTHYQAPAVIENIDFEGLDDNSFLRCGINGWGGSVIINRCKITKFNNEVMRLESVYWLSVEKTVVCSDGKIVMTTHDGTVTNANFCNCNQFVETIFVSYSGTSTPVQFELKNVLNLTFDRCQFDHVGLVLDCVDFVEHVAFNECWFESINAIYALGERSSKPTFKDCRYTYVTKIDESEGEISHVPGETILNVNGEYQHGFEALRSNDNRVLDGVTMYNPKDVYTEYTPVYSIGTRNTYFNQPLNTRTVTERKVLSVEYDLQKILLYSNSYCGFDVTICATFDDTSYIALTAKIAHVAGIWMVGDLRTEAKGSWSGAAAETSQFAVTADGGKLVFTSSNEMKLCVTAIRYNFI